MFELFGCPDESLEHRIAVVIPAARANWDWDDGGVAHGCLRFFLFGGLPSSLIHIMIGSPLVGQLAQWVNCDGGYVNGLNSRLACFPPHRAQPTIVVTTRCGLLMLRASRLRCDGLKFNGLAGDALACPEDGGEHRRYRNFALGTFRHQGDNPFGQAGPGVL